MPDERSRTSPRAPQASSMPLPSAPCGRRSCTVSRARQLDALLRPEYPHATIRPAEGFETLEAGLAVLSASGRSTSNRRTLTATDATCMGIIGSVTKRPSSHEPLRQVYCRMSRVTTRSARLDVSIDRDEAELELSRASDGRQRGKTAALPRRRDRTEHRPCPNRARRSALPWAEP